MQMVCSQGFNKKASLYEDCSAEGHLWCTVGGRSRWRDSTVLVRLVFSIWYGRSRWSDFTVLARPVCSIWHGRSRHLHWPTAFGIHGTILSWISSFLKNRTQTVTFAGSRSNTTDLKYGVSQGNVLGPVLFLLYTAEVTAIAHQHSVDAHSYTDEWRHTASYHRKADDLESSIPHLVTCIDEINCWIANRLKQNMDKLISLSEIRLVSSQSPNLPLTLPIFTSS